MKRIQSQCNAILAFMQGGGVITQAKAIGPQFGNCYRLASRIYDLKQRGHAISTRLVKKGDVKYSEYWIDQQTTLEV